MVVLSLVLPAAAAVPVMSNRLDRSLAALPGVAPTPPMGWNSWNSYRCNIDSQKVRQAADALVATGMREVGYRYVVVDDCWFAPQRAKDGALQGDPVRFPEGMKALADYVHQRGLRFGLYESPGQRTCAQLHGRYPGRTGSAGHERRDAQTFRDWGVDYLKYDWCATDSDLGHQLAAFLRMRDALRATGAHFVYSINPNSGITDAGVPATVVGSRYDWSGVATMWRTTNDVDSVWTYAPRQGRKMGIRDTVEVAVPQVVRSGPDHWVDLDMLEVGVHQDRQRPGLTAAEEHTQFGLWAMFAAPLIAGNVLPTMSRVTRDVLTNSDVIAVDQDPLVASAVSVSVARGLVWRRAMADGSLVVALWNRSEDSARLECDLATLGLAPGRYAVRDLWTGAATVADHTIAVDAVPHDTILLRVRPAG